MIEILKKFPKISSFFGNAGLHPVSHLALEIITFPPSLPLGSFQCSPLKPPISRSIGDS
jgi:hypothetical protein